MGKVKYLTVFFLIFLVGIATTNAEIGFGNDEPRVDIVTPSPEFVITSTTYLPDKINVTTGTLDSGNITSVQSAQDDDTFNVSEASGASPMTIIVNFSGVEDFNSIILREKYSGGAGHEIAIGLYDPGTNSYEEEYGKLTDMIGFAFTNIPVLDPQNHLNNGIVSLRLRHVNAGNPGHDFSLDYVSLVDGFTTITTSDHDALSNRNNIGNHAWAVAADGSRNSTHVFSTGEDHTFVNQDVTTGSNATFNTVFLDNDDFNFRLLGTSKIQDNVAQLTIDTLNNQRVLTISGNPEIADWFNQGVKTTSSPSFLGVTAGLTGFDSALYLLTFDNQDYLFTNRGEFFIVVESQESAEQHSFEHVSKDHDGTDNVNSIWWAEGDPVGNSVADRSFLQNGFITAAAVGDRYWKLHSASAGSGNSYPLKLYTEANTNQLKLKTDGSIVMAGVYDDDIGTERDLLINASGHLGYDSSSISFKKNVKNMTNEMSSKVLDLRPVTYDKINGKENQIGLIAEEVYELYPEFISYKREAIMGTCIDSIDNSTFECVDNYRLMINKTTGKFIPETISYKMLVTPLIKEVQNLNERLQDQDQRIAELESIVYGTTGRQIITEPQEELTNWWEFWK